MATYIVLSNWTDQGIKNVAQSPQRLAAAREMGGKFGVQVTAFYLTLGSYDTMVVCEAPDDRALATFVLSLAAAGNVRTITLKAFGEAAYRDLLQALA
jgi:uncharacterized protein with GYD domain